MRMIYGLQINMNSLASPRAQLSSSETEFGLLSWNEPKEGLCSLFLDQWLEALLRKEKAQKLRMCDIWNVSVFHYWMPAQRTFETEQRQVKVAVHTGIYENAEIL
jgi:hypothetical protein